MTGVTPSLEALSWRRLWAGKTAFVLASGPSLTLSDVTLVRRYARAHDCPVLVTNSTYRLAPWADVLFFHDSQWWRVHGEDVLRNFAGQIVTVCELDHPRMLNLRKQPFNAYKNSGGGAISFAMYAGARRVITLGLDGQPAPNGRQHWHAPDPVLGDATGLSLFLPCFPALEQDAAQQGVEIINASRQTAITCFQRQPLESILATNLVEE